MFCIALGELYDRPCNKRRGKDMGEEKCSDREREREREKAYSWTTEDGIIIECEIEVPEISNFCNVSLDARDFSRCRIQSLSLQGNGRCNWRKIDAKGVGPDEESERERTSSEVRTINTCSLRRTVSPSLPLSLSRPSFALLCFTSLSLVGRGYPQNLAGLSYTQASLRVREDRDSLLRRSF